MSMIDRNDIATEALTKYPSDDDKIPASVLLILRSEFFNSKDFFTLEETEQILEAIETLYQLERQGLNQTQLKERSKALLGKKHSLSENSTIISILIRLAFKKQRQDIIESINEIEKDKNPYAQKKKLLKLIKQLSKTYKQSSDIKEILNGLASHIAHDLLEQQVQEMKASLKKEMIKAGFDKPGTSKEMSCSLSVGAGIASSGEVKTEASVRFTLEVGDNGKIKESKGLSTTLTGTTGVPFAKLKARGQASTSKAKVYADIDDWLNANEGQLLKIVVASYRPDKAMSTALDSILKSKEKKAIQKRQSRLQEMLIRQGLIDTGDTLAPFHEDKPKRALKSTTTSLGASLGGSVGMSILSAGVSGGRTKSKTKWIRHEDLAVYMRDHPEQFFDENSLGGLFYLVHVKDSIQYGELKRAYQNLSKLIKPHLDVKETGPIDTFLYDPTLDLEKHMKALEDLETEYLEYSAIVNKLDAELQKREGLSVQEQVQQQTMIDQLRKRKAEMESARIDRSELKESQGKGRTLLKGRAEYYRSILMTYFMIQNSIDLMHLTQELQGDEVSPEQLKQLQRFEHIFSSPNFRMREQDHKFLSVPKTLEGKKKHDVYSMEVLGFTVSVEKLNIKDANNLDDNGDYIVVSLPLMASSWLNTELPELLSDIEALSIPHEVTASLREQLTSLGGAADFFEIGAQKNMSFVFVKGIDDKYHLQYQRETRTFNLGGKASGNVSAAVTMGGGLKSSATKALHEKIGTNTLTYVMTRFNGLDLNEISEVENSEPWRTFKEENRPAFHKIILALLDNESNIYLEMEDMHTQLQEADTSSIAGSSQDAPINQIILEAARSYQLEPNVRNYQQALKELEQLFRLYHKHVYKPTQMGQFEHSHSSPARQRRNRSPARGQRPKRSGVTQTLLKLSEKEASPERAQVWREAAEQRKESPSQDVVDSSKARRNARKDK